MEFTLERKRWRRIRNGGIRMSAANVQKVIFSDKGRIVEVQKIHENIPRPIQGYEKEINHLKMQLAAKDTEIKQKNEEIRECNKVIEHEYKVKRVLCDTIKVQEQKIRKMRGESDGTKA